MHRLFACDDSRMPMSAIGVLQPGHYLGRATIPAGLAAYVPF